MHGNGLEENLDKSKAVCVFALLHMFPGVSWLEIELWNSGVHLEEVSQLVCVGMWNFFSNATSAPKEFFLAREEERRVSRTTGAPVIRCGPSVYNTRP